jgi:hypothetical protein
MISQLLLLLCPRLSEPINAWCQQQACCFGSRKLVQKKRVIRVTARLNRCAMQHRVREKIICYKKLLPPLVPLNWVPLLKAN